MKYRRLTLVELQELKKEFEYFLSSQQVTADDWEQTKKEFPEKANELINIFSDLVFDKVVRKIEYLEFRTPDVVKLFHCGDEEITMVGMEVPDPNLDLTELEAINKAVDKPATIQGNIRVFRKSMPYTMDREKEIFDMTQNGYYVIEGDLYRQMERIYNTTQ